MNASISELSHMAAIRRLIQLSAKTEVPLPWQYIAVSCSIFSSRLGLLCLSEANRIDKSNSHFLGTYMAQSILFSLFTFVTQIHYMDMLPKDKPVISMYSMIAHGHFAHLQAVDTRPLFRGLGGGRPGNDARYISGLVVYEGRLGMNSHDPQ